MIITQRKSRDTSRRIINHFLSAYQIALTLLFVVGFLRVVYGLITGECGHASFELYN